MHEIQYAAWSMDVWWCHQAQRRTRSSVPACASPWRQSPDAEVGYRRIGVGEVIFVFRDPFDFETIERVREVRAALSD